MQWIGGFDKLAGNSTIWGKDGKRLCMCVRQKQEKAKDLSD
jgi:hypothetical protein